MHVTLRYPEPRGVRANTAFYGFYARATGELRSLIEEAQHKLTDHYGAPPSNAVLLRDALRVLVSRGVDANLRAGITRRL